MSTWMHIAGGLAQGLGAGMNQAQKMADEERLRIAMERMASERMEKQYELMGENQAASDQRQADLTLTRDANQREYEANMAQAGARAKKEEREFKLSADLKMLDAETQASIRKSVAVINAEAKADGGRIADVKVDGPTGAVFGITKNGDVINLTKAGGAIARPAPSRTSSRSSDLFANPGGGTTASQPIKPDFIWDPEKGLVAGGR